MTIAVIWQEDGLQWCAADTRLVTNYDDRPATDIAAKIYAIPIATSAIDEDGFSRQRHYWTQYGFVYSGAALPASMTAVTASTLLQTLTSISGRIDPPSFEQIAQLICRLANRFMMERRRFGSEGLFSAAVFGWCPHHSDFRVAFIDGRNDADTFRVELSYPARPNNDGQPWLVIGGAASKFHSELANCQSTAGLPTKRLPRRVIDKMIADELDGTVGGATSIGVAHQHGFDLFYAVEPIIAGQPAARRIFNGLDIDNDVGAIGNYFVGINGIA